MSKAHRFVAKQLKTRMLGILWVLIAINIRGREFVYGNNKDGLLVRGFARNLDQAE